MLLYFATGQGGVTKLDILQKGGAINFLSSAYELLEMRSERINKFMLMTKAGGKFFLDSGAYSAWARNESVNINKYAELIDRHSEYISEYAGLDVIGDWKATLYNQEWMENRGYKPIWTYHITKQGPEPYSLLDKMLSDHKRIALSGGATGIRRDVLIRHFDKCWQIIRKHWPVRVHAFGMTRHDILARYPWYSADSISWLMGERAGAIYEFVGGNMTHYSSSQQAGAMRFGDRSMVDNRKLQEKNYRNRDYHNIAEFIKMQDFITQLWIRRGIEWDDK